MTDSSMPDIAVADRWARLRVRLADWFTLLVVVCLVGVAVGGWLSYDTYVDPGTTEVERTHPLFERSGSYGYQATVTRPTELYPAGTPLRSRPVYFTAVSPVLDGGLVYRYASPHDDAVTVTTRSELVTRSTDRTGDTEYWRTTRSLTRTETTEVSGSGVVRVPIRVNVSAVTARADRIGTDLGGDPGRPSATVRTTVHVRGSVDGESVDLTDTFVLHVGLQGGTFTVAQPAQGTTAVETTETVTVPVTHGPVRQAGSVLLVLAAAGGLFGLVTCRQTGRLDVSDADREWLSFTADRRASDDWITTGTLDGDVDALPTVSVESLDALVDAAIDGDTRVLALSDREQYLVVTDRLVYAYEPPSRPPRH